MQKAKKQDYEKRLAKARMKDQTELTEQQKEDMKEIFEIAKQPSIFKDEDFACGEGELDIRELNEKNYKQVMFRMQCNTLTYIRSLNQNITDLTRIVMVLARKLAKVENFTKEDEELTEALKKEISSSKGGEKCA